VPRHLPPLLAFALTLLAPPARAQLPQARLDRLFPLGGAAGSSVIVTVQGKDLDDLTGLHIDRPGFTATLLKPNQFRLTIPAGATPGTVEVRTVGKYGISGSRLFAVQKGLTEVLEKEPNDTPATAQKVPLDCAINGQSDSDGDDYFRFTARKGQRIVIDCLARRLDSTLRPSLVASDSTGKEIARSRPYFLRTDPLLDLAIPADGDYVVGLHDATYAGGLPYRLVITTKPHLESAFPSAIAPGDTTTFTLLGRNLPGATPFKGGLVLDRFLDALPFRLAAPPRDDLARQRFDFLVHPSAPSVSTRGWQLLPGLTTPGSPAALNPVTLVHADAPVVIEKEPNDSRDTAQSVKLPATVCGRLDKPGDADWYRLELAAGEEVQIDLLCERLDLPGDLFVIVTDSKGNELLHLDDHGINHNALSLYNRDPLGVFRAPARGSYYLLVQDRYRQGGPRHAYVLRLGKPAGDFFPVAFHETNPDPTSPLVRQGGSAFVEVCLNRRNFRGPVVIEAKGLPPGVTCPPVHVSPQTEFAVVVFTATAEAKEWAGSIRLEATATIDGKKVTRELRNVQRRWAIANVNTCRPCRLLCLAIRQNAPYGLRLPEKATVAAGATVELKVSVRRWAGFSGKVGLAGLDLPPGFGFATSAIPAGKDEVTAKLSVAGNVPPGTYSIVLRGDAQVPFSRDPKAASKPNVRVADPSTPVMLTVTAPAKR
jgi:hypothetical protein